MVYLKLCNAVDEELIGKVNVLSDDAPLEHVSTARVLCTNGRHTSVRLPSILFHLILHRT
jgi:hypothetical protein